MQRQEKLAMVALEEAIKLYMNERLFQGGYISEELYTRAKIIIVKMEAGT